MPRSCPGPTSRSPSPRAPSSSHTKIPEGKAGRVLRIADTADEGWTATLDGAPLTKTTVDGWAQGFELPATGGRLDVTFDAPISHAAWLWAQGALALVLVVLALPGRRRDVDDDLPEEPVVPAQAVEGEGRRARRLRAQAEAEQAEQAAAEGTDGAVPPPPSEEELAAAGVPHQQSYGEWDTSTYAAADYGQYPAGDQQQYQGGAYQGTYDPTQQDPYQADPYQAGQYDPYAYGGTYDAQQQYGQQAYDAPYEQPQPPAQPPHGTDSERPDGSQQ